MSTIPRFSDRLDAAFRFARTAHATQGKKGTRVPYLAHLLGVTALVLESGGDEDEAVAALLHDAPEDQGGERTLRAIRQRFGDRVAAIVLGCSDTLEDPKPPWRARKEAYLHHLESADSATLLVSLADKVYNCRSIVFDYRREGEALWSRFTADRDGTLWYYRSLLEVFHRRAPQDLTDLVGELERSVATLERLVAARGSRPG